MLSVTPLNTSLSGVITYLIGGPLGVGKTSLLRHLLGQKPGGERWAVMINEFGQVGLDAALLATDADGIAIAEIAGGCICCVNGVPFQVGLARLLRRTRPQRLFIEASGLGHPLAMLEQLRAPPWQGVLQVQPLIMLVAGPGGAQPAPAQSDIYAQAGLVVATQADLAQPGDYAQALERWQGTPLCWVAHGVLNLSALPQVPPGAVEPAILMPTLTPVSEAHDQGLARVSEIGGYWSIGWQWPAVTLFNAEVLLNVLQPWRWARCKAVIHSRDGWVSLNARSAGPLDWRPSEWRRDNRLELIFQAPQLRAELEAAIATAQSPG